MFESKLVLDTCALLWLASGDKRLSPKTLTLIEGASLVFVSAISAWEISLKAERGQLSLPLPADEWFREVLNHHNLILAPLEVDILIGANRLPWHHRDPVDRFIIATAHTQKAAVVTSDRKFNNYDVRVLPCSR